LAVETGTLQRTIQQRLQWLRRHSLVERNGRSWRRTEPERLEAAARDLGTAGEGARLCERHAVERESYQERSEHDRAPRGRLKLVMDAPESHEAELAAAIEAVTQVFPNARLV